MLYDIKHNIRILKKDSTLLAGTMNGLDSKSISSSAQVCTALCEQFPVIHIVTTTYSVVILVKYHKQFF